MITLSTIIYAPVGAAWKTPRMRGYLEKVEQTPTGTNVDAFGLKFVDTVSNNTDKVYVFQKASDSDTYTCTGPDTVADQLVLDNWLLELILSGDWRQGNASDFNEQMTSEKTW